MSPAPLNWTALLVFVFFFLLVTVLGFVAARWKSGDLGQLHEWGLGGRRFGTIITWFLIGGDFYTAYTMIAVPALVYSLGAYGFFALPYTIIVYPIVFSVMPRLWNVCHQNNYITAADYIAERFASKWLALAVAITGLVATMPYIALQLIGMQVAIAGLGVGGGGFPGVKSLVAQFPWLGTVVNDSPLIVAFIILALYTYTSGLRAPAMIAFVKDVMIYIVVIAAVAIIPLRLGGYGAVFHAVDQAFQTKGSATGLLLKPAQALPFASLALGSALAAFMYPHTMTAVLSSSSVDTVRKNAILLPLYTILLGLIALLGYMAIAAGIKLDKPTGVVPALFNKIFPDWFAGFSFAAIAIGALVPAAIMSIGAANLFTRNIWKAFLRPGTSPTGESIVAKNVSLLVKIGALAFIIFLPTQYAIDLQLLGGIWILQIFPSVVFGLYRTRVHANCLLLGWLAGMTIGTVLAESMQLKPVYPLQFAGQTYTVYIGLIALSANVVVSFAASWILTVAGAKPAS
ncbi:MAG TPA: sodium:solute symporter [Chthoniobacterales bacterium]|jgi:SSS family solute:Na+ symporter|nr:sodium:solute symporter [Chthoniobacterales bacterium]